MTQNVIRELQLFFSSQPSRFYISHKSRLLYAKGHTMSVGKVEDKALRLLAAFKNTGKPVARIVVEGRKIEIVLSKQQSLDEFDEIDMRHGET